MSGKRERLHGVHPVREALRAGRRRAYRLLVRSGARRPELRELCTLAETAGVPIVEVSLEELRGSLPGGIPDQGVALDVDPLPTVLLEALWADPAPGGRRILVALDGVEDPQNVGAILRVADAAGASGLIATERRAAPAGPAMARASSGAIEWVPMARVTNLARALRAAKEAGHWVVGLDPEAETSLPPREDRVWEGDLVLVLGAEGRGLRPGVRALVDHPIRIPMAGHVASLNVATAAAVALFRAAEAGRPAS